MFCHGCRRNSSVVDLEFVPAVRVPCVRVHAVHTHDARAGVTDLHSDQVWPGQSPIRFNRQETG